MALCRLFLSLEGASRWITAPFRAAGEFNDLVLQKTQPPWNIYITRQMSKRHFLGYAGRYIRRLPISQRRILDVTEQEVVYQYKDTRRSKETRIKIVQEARSTPAEFVAMLSQHVLDRCQHSMRYYGLLAPRAKRTTSPAVFLLLDQKQRSRPPRLSWRNSLLRDFHIDPLLDNHGQRMHWIRHLQPTSA